MNRHDVLILADGIVAKHLIQRILEDSFTSNSYHVVYMDDALKPDEIKDHFYFYHFDPTSFIKLSKLFNKNFKEVLIVLGNKIDTCAAYENVRKLDKNLSIVLYDRWDLDIDDKNIIKLEANEILANRLFDYLPNVPVIAQNVGLGHGEIMEVLVPFGSSYVYRHIGTIEQKNWQIAAIYRNNRLILPKPDLMIWPNDLLLLIGEPEVLKQVFKSIKREVGQFPLPFGLNSYLYIDMSLHKMEVLRHILLEAIYLHKKINDKKLFIRIVNPNDFEFLDLVKRFDSSTIEVMIDYTSQERDLLIENDLKESRVGLFMTHFDNFFLHRSYLYKKRIPVLALSQVNFAILKELSLILLADKGLEKISSPLFDLAIQLGIDITLYEQNSLDQNNSIKGLVEHFENLAHIFSKKLSVKKAKTNIIKELMQKEQLLLAYPFTEDIVKANRYNIFCTNPLRLFYKLNKFHQFFIPVE